MHDFDDLWQDLMESETPLPGSLAPGLMNEYLDLKNNNDAIRNKESARFVSLFTKVVSEANRRGLKIITEKVEPHRFPMLDAIMAGFLLRFRHGLRCLEIETGWTKTPGDGFMRGNALVCAKISHFGRARENQELALIREEGAPRWFSVDGERRLSPFGVEGLRRHFEVFMGD